MGLAMLHKTGLDWSSWFSFLKRQGSEGGSESAAAGVGATASDKNGVTDVTNESSKAVMENSSSNTPERQ